ncbi:MAG: sulfatase-like hydrolase/transferase [Kiritimatiellia bacterium]|nr:sulfatase-like hydrolase/transferase [Lentisphaerota bacterium]
MQRKPNVILFVAESYRGDVLGHAGNPGAVTPNLDALVGRDAVSYSNAFSQNPVCTPSRCSFMTGWYPHVHGHRSMRNLLKDHEPHLLKVLRQEGYRVWWGGKNDLVAVESPEDYQKHCDIKYRSDQQQTDEGYRLQPLPEDDPRYRLYYRGVAERGGAGQPYRHKDEALVDGALDVIARHQGTQPLCIYLPLSLVHPAYVTTRKYYDLINPDLLPPCLPVGRGEPPVLAALRQAYGASAVTDEQWRDIRRIYYAMCAQVDDLFGRVVEALRRQGMYDETLLAFFSDHGDFTGDYGLPEKTHATLQDCLLHVPLIIKPPADVAVKPGLRRQLTELLDVSATIYDLLGIEPGYTCQGSSLRASLAGDESELHHAVFAEVGSRRGETSFKNMEAKASPPGSFYQVQSGAALPFADAGTYAVMCRTLAHKYVRRGYTGHHELYDLRQDPGELCNLAGDPAHAALESEMQSCLLEYFMRTGDVLPLKQDRRG